MFIDETGNIYGRWMVLGRAGKTGSSWNWMCQCDCGKTKVLRGSVLRNGGSKSCGCLRIEAITTHGKTDTAEYAAWHNIIERCCNPLSRNYRHYGGRGISIAPEWRHDFVAFLNHIGPRPSESHSIERIDNNGGYVPGNIRWATHTEQMRNRRCNRLITHEGRTLCLTAWAMELGISPGTIYKRLRNGHPPLEARRASA